MRKDCIYWFCLVVLIVIGVGIRFALIASGWQEPLDSDEATTGLMALHIAYRGELPLMFYGQGFLGAFEAYSAAPFFKVFGPSTFMLRITPVVLFIPFLFMVYVLIKLLYTRLLALIVISLLVLVTSNTVFRQIEVAGGRAETPIFGVLLLLLATWLALTFDKKSVGRKRIQRLVVYICWGIVAGVAFWNDPLVVAFIIFSFWLLWRTCRVELSPPSLVIVSLAVVLGCFPFILYTITHLGSPAIQGPGSVFIPILLPTFWHNAPPFPLILLYSLAGTLIVSIPVAIGADALCPLRSIDPWTTALTGSPQEVGCTLYNLTMGSVVIVLIVLSFMPLLHKCWQQRKMNLIEINGEKRQVFVLNEARFAVCAVGVTTLCIYMFSPNPALVPWASSRYLIVMYVCYPAVIWFLLGKAVNPAFKIARWGLYGVLITSLILGTIGCFQSISSFKPQQAEKGIGLVAFMMQRHDQYLYTDYWTCNRLIFLSRESIVCAVLDEKLKPGFDRYQPYVEQVQKHAMQAAYVFPAHSQQSKAFAQQIAATKGSYTAVYYQNYIIYEPLLKKVL